MIGVIGLIVLGAVIIAIITMTIVCHHLDYGLPYTRRRKLFQIKSRIHQLEWEMNIGGVRQWKVEKRFDGKWQAVGPHPRFRDASDSRLCKNWKEAMWYANERAKECATETPQTYF